MTVNQSAPRGTIVPSLIYNDVARAIEWLCDVFGFKERLRAANAEGNVGHAQLAIGQGGVILGQARKGQGFATADTAEFRPPRPNEVNQVLSVHVANVDQHYERARERGARILNPPTTYPYGERQYTAVDLEGHRWTFSQSVTDVPPAEWGATVADLGGGLDTLPKPRLCYLEIPAADVHQSAQFYEKVFGWNIRRRDTNRPSFDDAAGQVSGAWVTGRASSREPGLLPYIWVDDIDATLAEAAAQGAEVVEGPHRDSPGGEWIATFRDPAGNLIGLYHAGPRRGDATPPDAGTQA